MSWKKIRKKKVIISFLWTIHQFFLYKVNKHPKFDANFDIRRQLGHFKYEINWTYVTMKKVYWWTNFRYSESMQRIWPMRLTFSTLHTLKLTFFAYVSSKPISLKLQYIVGRSQKLEKKIPIILELTWQAYSWEVISNNLVFFSNLWPSQNI